MQDAGFMIQDENNILHPVSVFIRANQWLIKNDQ
jgi:hypothetical protein